MASEIIVRLHRPELTEKERARRMEQIKKAAADLLAATEEERRKRDAQST